MTLTRSLLAVLIPGIIATTPIVLALIVALDAGELYRAYPTFANAFIFCIAAITGSFCEGLGTNFEVQWDAKRQRKYRVTRNWYDYLARTLSPEPVAYRYMSRLATTLYFELSMSVALVLFGAGVALLIQFHAEHLSWLLALVALGCSYGLSWYFYHQAWCTHDV